MLCVIRGASVDLVRICLFAGCYFVWFVAGWFIVVLFFFFQAEDGIRDLVRSRGLGDVYKRQVQHQQRVRVEHDHILDALGQIEMRTDLQVLGLEPLSLIHI